MFQLKNQWDYTRLTTVLVFKITTRNADNSSPPNEQLHLKITHPLLKIYQEHSTEGVSVSNGSAYWTHEISTPCGRFDKVLYRGYMTFKRIAQYANPFEDHTPTVEDL